jgi:hypothetical protein
MAADATMNSFKKGVTSNFSAEFEHTSPEIPLSHLKNQFQ